jgi:hypothetical protein
MAFPPVIQGMGLEDNAPRRAANGLIKQKALEDYVFVVKESIKRRRKARRDSRFPFRRFLQQEEKDKGNGHH